MKVGYKYYLNHYTYLVLLTILSLLVYWWGWHNSSQNDGMPFSRSGAIATTILLAFVVSKYTERLEYLLKNINEMIEKGGNWTDASKDAREDLNYKIKTKFDQTKSCIQYWYTCLMLIATLIWGFGDQVYLIANDQVFSACEFIKLIHLQTK